MSDEDTKKKEPIGTVAIIRKGEQIVVPPGMPYSEAITWLSRQMEEENREYDFEHDLDAFPLEGAFALSEVLRERYGFFQAKVPFTIDIDVDVNKTAPVPWAQFSIPNMDGTIVPKIVFKDNRLQFAICGTAKQRHREQIDTIVKLTREKLTNNSIYRGHAIKVKFENDPSKFNPRDCPKFLDVSKTDARGLVFSESLARIVQCNLFTPVEKTEQCRQYKVPLKRGILLEGTYGCGKTLTAYVAARKCVENGWTFIYLESVAQLAQAIAFSKQYQPCMIFAEDIDRVVAGERSVSMDQILNTIDGIDTKQTETIVVLTTNDVDCINKAMLRPGRIDVVISVVPPDAGAVVQLIELYSNGLLAQGEDFSTTGKLLEGRIPAVIREVVERSKLAAITRIAPGEELTLRAVDLETAAETMVQHLELLEEDDDESTESERLMEILGEKLASAIAYAVEGANEENIKIKHPPTNGKHAATPSP